MADIFIQSFMCPHCDTQASFLGKGFGRDFVLLCNSCRKGVYFKLNQTRYIDYGMPNTITVEVEGIIDYYPRLVPKINSAIPPEVSVDFTEAIKCENISAPKASVAMCRRVMQTSCILKGMSPSADLIDQIDELEQKRIINPSLKDMAHTIRLIGNWGVHPQKDALRDVTIEDASEVLHFTEELLDEVFVRPQRIKDLKTKKGIK